MQSMRPSAFRNVVGQEWMDGKSEDFPKQGWGSITKGNVIYVWFKSNVHMMELARLEQSSGKLVKICVVPKSITGRI